MPFTIHPLRKRPMPVRRAHDSTTNQPIPMNSQTLQGKLTYLGILISALGAAGNLLGWTIPTDEVKGMISWVQANWDDIAQFAGLVTAAYGRLRINWRKS